VARSGTVRSKPPRPPCSAAQLQELAPVLPNRAPLPQLVKWLDWEFAARWAAARLATRSRGLIEGRERRIFSLDTTLWGRATLTSTEALSDCGPSWTLRILYGSTTWANPYCVRRQLDQAMHYYQTSLDMSRFRQGMAHYWKARVFGRWGNLKEVN